MKKKLFFIIVVVILLLIFVVPKGKKDNVNIKKDDYGNFNLKTGVQYLKEKANDISITNYNDGNKGEMYTFSHEATNQTTTQTDYRYIGDNPNNYVYFNCEDETDTSTCEVWRIVGVFSTQNENNNTEENIKIVRGEPLESQLAYSSDDNNRWYSSSLKFFLNEDYLNRSNDASSYGMFNSSRNLISSVKYYLGGLRENSSEPLFGSADTLYMQERSYDFYDNNNQQNNINWIGKIGLMYPSDNYYIYSKGVDDVCYNNPRECNNEHARKGWFYNIISDRHIWFISPGAVYEYGSYYNAFMFGGVMIFSNPATPKNIEPTVYLKSNVFIVGGDGTEASPYILSSYKNYVTDLYEKITYNGVEYYVIDENDENDYVTLLKADPLSYKDVKKYAKKENIDVKKSGDYGIVQYYYADDCYYNNNADKNLSGCTTNYDSSFVKKIIDGWVNENVCAESLTDVNNYTSRILSIDDLVGKLGYSPDQLVTDSWYRLTTDVPDWVYNSLYTQWTMTPTGDNSKSVYFIQKDGNVSDEYRGIHVESYLSSYNTVRPIINVKKSMLNSSCKKSNGNKVCKEVTEIIGYDFYNFGDIINYKNNDYYVIEDSNENQKYIKLLKKIPLTVEEVLNYGRNSDDFLFVNSYVTNIHDLDNKVLSLNNENIAGVAYYSSDGCYKKFIMTDHGYDSDYYTDIDYGCKNNYNESDVKKLVDNWSNIYNEDLIEIDGYKARLITLDELLENFDFTLVPYASSEIYQNNGVEGWLTKYSFWTMTPYLDSENNMLAVSYGITSVLPSNSYISVRPVINLNKCALEDGCIYDTVLECEEINDNDYNEIDTNIVNKNDLIGKVVVTVANTLKYLPQIIIIISSILIVIGLSILGYNYYKSRKERR